MSKSSIEDINTLKWSMMLTIKQTIGRYESPIREWNSPTTYRISIERPEVFSGRPTGFRIEREAKIFGEYLFKLNFSYPKNMFADLFSSLSLKIDADDANVHSIVVSEFNTEYVKRKRRQFSIPDIKSRLAFYKEVRYHQRYDCESVLAYLTEHPEAFLSESDFHIEIARRFDPNKGMETYRFLLHLSPFLRPVPLNPLRYIDMKMNVSDGEIQILQNAAEKIKKDIVSLCRMMQDQMLPHKGEAQTQASDGTGDDINSIFV